MKMTAARLRPQHAVHLSPDSGLDWTVPYRSRSHQSPFKLPSESFESGTMARFTKTLQDTPDVLIKRLLDQRATRADVHVPPSPSVYTDVSSVYSSSVVSPRPQPRKLSYTSSSYDQERLDDPASSMLDMDDDGHSSSYDSDDSDDGPEDRQDNDNDGNDSPLRMSMLGPKMRFHSRAPWETGEDPLEEEDESDHSAHRIGGASFGTPSGERTSKPMGSRMGFGSTLSKTRSHSVGRPSTESSRSTTKSQRSFNRTSSDRSSQSLLPTPVASIPDVSSPLSHVILRNKFLATHGHATTLSVASSSTNSPNPSPSAGEFRFSSASSVPWVTVDGRKHPAPSLSSYQEEDMHPYANPDLVVTFTETSPEPSPIKPNHVASTVPRSDSSITVTNSVSSRSTMTLPLDTSSPHGRSKEKSTRTGASTIQGKEISSPMSFHRPGLPTKEGPANREPKLSLPAALEANNAFSGFTNGATPGFTLISLEEARSQRARSVTANAATSQPKSSIDFPAHGGDSGGTRTNRTFSVSTTRVRSISAGAKAKVALHSIVGTSSAVPEGGTGELSRPPSPAGSISASSKGVKHKRSGFLRMFNAKEKEKEKGKEIPPVPQLSNSYAAQNHRSPARKQPVNSSTPNLTPDYGSNSTNAPPVPSLKRTPPPLSINTLPSNGFRPPPSATASDYNIRTDQFSLLDPDNVPPQSAPADANGFPALKLRPVSTFFGAQFHEQFGTSNLANELVVGPQSPANSVQPSISVTLDTSIRHDALSIRSGMGPDDPYVSIQTLRDQLASSKKTSQLEIWDLQGQIRDLKTEIEELRAAEDGYCEACGRGKQLTGSQDSAMKGGVVNRPRTRTGTSARFGNSN